MKKSILLAVAALTPLTLFAQTPTAASGGLAPPPATPGIDPATTPAAPRLPQVKFVDTSLKEVIEYLQLRSKEAGHDPHTDPLNVVISPGLEDQRVPSISLRNVSPTEVLTVATTVLGLRLEPISGDHGDTVAWLIKAGAGQVGPEGGGIPFAPSPAGAGTIAPSPGALPGAPTASRFSPIEVNVAPGAGGGPVPYVVEVAASPASTGGAAMATPPAPRVFGIAPLLAVPFAASADEREKERAMKFERLIHNLKQLSDDQGIKTDIRAYGELDIIVVKSPDPAGLTLIAEAIEAMKSNVSQTKTPDNIPRGTGSR